MSDKLYDDFWDPTENPKSADKRRPQKPRISMNRTEFRQTIYNAHRAIYGEESNNRMVPTLTERQIQSDSTRRSVYDLVVWIQSGAELEDAETSAGDLGMVAGLLHAAVSSQYAVKDVAETAFDMYINREQANERHRRAFSAATKTMTLGEHLMKSVTFRNPR